MRVNLDLDQRSSNTRKPRLFIDQDLKRTPNHCKIRNQSRDLKDSKSWRSLACSLNMSRYFYFSEDPWSEIDMLQSDDFVFWRTWPLNSPLIECWNKNYINLCVSSCCEFLLSVPNKGRLGLRLAHKSSSILDYIHENHAIAITRSSSSCADPRLKVAFKYLNQCHCPGWGFKYLKYYHCTAIIRLHHIKSESLTLRHSLLKLRINIFCYFSD